MVQKDCTDAVEEGNASKEITGLDSETHASCHTTTGNGTAKRQNFSWKRFDLIAAWGLLLVANIGHVYSGVTFLGDRKDCYTCTNNSTVIPWFIFYTSWCLWLTSAFFVALQCTSRIRLIKILFRMALPWSITTSISYSYYLATKNGGSDLVDHVLCYTISDSAIPRVTPRAWAITFLIGDRLTNFTAHFGCSVINLLIYKFCRTLDYKCDRLSWHGFTAYFILGIVILTVHLNVDEVYCTDSIRMSILLSVVVFAVVHSLLLLADWRRTSRA